MKNAFDRRKSALWITASLAAAAIVPAVVLLKRTRKKAEFPFDQALCVKDIIYQAPFYSFSYTIETAPLYRFTPDHELLVKGDVPPNEARGGWISLGSMTGCRLDKERFDELFFTGKEREIVRIRKKNEKAWQLDVTDDPKEVFYYLMQQKNGDVYLAYGYYTDGKDSPESQASIVRWLFRLIPVRSG